MSSNKKHTVNLNRAGVAGNTQSTEMTPRRCTIASYYYSSTAVAASTCRPLSYKIIESTYVTVFTQAYETHHFHLARNNRQRRDISRADIIMMSVGTQAVLITGVTTAVGHYGHACLPLMELAQLHQFGSLCLHDCISSGLVVHEHLTFSRSSRPYKPTEQLWFICYTYCLLKYSSKELD